MKNRVDNQVSAGKTNRFMELEGLRGLAALVVFIFHFLIIFYPVMYYGNLPDLAPIQHFRFEDNIHGSPLIAFISGTFSVAIFFVLSGFVLTIGFFQTGKTKIIKKLAIKRYLRLMLPALASVLIAWILIRLHFSRVNELYSISLSGALQHSWQMVPHLAGALREGLVDIFVVGPVREYNSVLWTMKFEFIGSFIVFTLALIFGNSSKRWLVYAALALALYNTWYLGFVIGMVLADLYANRFYWLQKVKAPFALSLLAIGIVIGAFPTATSAGTIYQYISLSWLTPAENQSLYVTIGALFVVFAVLSVERIRSFMSSRIIGGLGKYTYSFYLVHQPIIYTLGAGLFVMFVGFMGYNKSVLLAVLLTIPVVVAATYLFHRFIERPSVALANSFERVYSGEKALPSVKQAWQKARLNMLALVTRLRPSKRAEPEVDLELE